MKDDETKCFNISLSQFWRNMIGTWIWLREWHEGTSTYEHSRLISTEKLRLDLDLLRSRDYEEMGAMFEPCRGRQKTYLKTVLMFVPHSLICTVLNTYILPSCTFSTLHGLQILDPIQAHGHKPCIHESVSAHPLEPRTPCDILVNYSHALSTKPVSIVYLSYHPSTYILVWHAL